MHRTARFTAGVGVVATAALVTILLVGWFVFADTPFGSRFSFQPYATPVALGIVIIFLLISQLALAAIPLVAYLFVRSYRFVSREVRRLLPEGQPLLAMPPPDDVGVLLITGLAEGHRLASEAH